MMWLVLPRIPSPSLVRLPHRTPPTRDGAIFDPWARVMNKLFLKEAPKEVERFQWLHFATLTPKAKLIAVSSPMQAVIVASATTVHTEQTLKAIETGYKDEGKLAGMTHVNTHTYAYHRAARWRSSSGFRMIAAGQEDTTETFWHAQESRRRHARPQLSLVNLYKPTGIRREIPPDYCGRFREAFFVVETNEFTACCVDDTEPTTEPAGAVNAVNAVKDRLRAAGEPDNGKQD
ncbi:hypothetical protein CTA2_7377 [Colletotrichum tanaceti]|uniref:Uncharacterized protein n=1 Tax=Colletotrichum tanaceti TaxID=1306861 RepID=A0A4U6X856_9PEZI|nr:hypothetical protein CTA2_7377 [Colletotrichum tanaceti]TKW51682.1 hypothetical protein CTA1_2827 [Colletotrichum tanaceti]